MGQRGPAAGRGGNGQGRQGLEAGPRSGSASGRFMRRAKGWGPGERRIGGPGPPATDLQAEHTACGVVRSVEWEGDQWSGTID